MSTKAGVLQRTLDHRTWPPRSCPKPPLTGDTATETTKAFGYFKTNAQRMRYAYFREHGMFIGSGVVGGGCKAVIGQRLKLSGMRWNIPGATGILTLRCAQAGNRFERIRTHQHDRTATA